MTNDNQITIIQNDTQLTGKITQCHRLEVYGYVQGDINADTIYVHEGGKLFGNINAKNAVISGETQGDIKIEELIKILNTGSVKGEVQYGQLALENGGELSADVRNVAPEIGGDLHLLVKKGKSVPITLSDLSAFDPDDGAEDLKFSISNLQNGYVSLKPTTSNPVKEFTQADLEAGKVMFVHNGTSGPKAGFDVVVADDDGATSGAPKTVAVDVNQAI